MSDMAYGPGYSTVVGLSQEMAIGCRLSQENILKILLRIGFFEERYGNKDVVMNKISDLANAGCSIERIFASIKLLPGVANPEKSMELSDNIVDASGDELAGRKRILRTYNPDISRRAVDL